MLLLFVVVPLLSKMNGVLKGKGLELGADSPLTESHGLEGGGGRERGNCT